MHTFNLWLPSIRMKRKLFIFIFAFVCIAQTLWSQEKALIYGKVTNDYNNPLDLVNVTIFGEPGGTITNRKGKYTFYIPANKENKVVFSFIGYKKEEFLITLEPGQKKELNVTLQLEASQLPDFKVVEKYVNSGNIVKVNPKSADKIPSLSGGVESLIKTLPGVSSSNELSSQYNVRGGNFDENLVYVNDVQVYRPFLIRSGEQEGLSFINSELVSSISFSAGGFDAKYGDKMSSVLDIKYKDPYEFGGSASISLLGASAHIEGASANQRYTYLVGVRRKSNQYVLNSLETEGDYQPTFTDVQMLTSYDISEHLEMSFLGNYSKNQYKVVPEKRETNFGTLSEAYRLTVYFDGQEVDDFETMLGAVTFKYNPSNKLNLKFIASAFRTQESETYDIMGQYWLDEVETSLGQDDFGNKKQNFGIGTYIDHARNYLTADVLSLEHKGTRSSEKQVWNWGIKYNNESIDDKLSEWKMTDSAGYSLPHYQDSVGYTDPSLQPDRQIELSEHLIAENILSSNRISGYIQNKWLWKYPSHNISLTTGVRSSFWDLNEEITFSPRSSLVIDPKWKRDFHFRLAAGVYHQPAFYRELRHFDGTLNKDIKAQSSMHFVLGSDYSFTSWGRPFKYTTEVYYKYLDNLIPYEIDNVRVRYYADNLSHGYATGIDMKVNGEFVHDIESWASLSLMLTQEDIEGDYYYKYFNESGKEITRETESQVVVDSTRVTPGYIPRPTDRRFNFSMFFQDYLPSNPTYKMNLNFIYGSGLPFGPPSFERYKDTLRMPPYFRVDIGFSKQLAGENIKTSSKSIFRHFESLWVSFEVFNLLQSNNTISYLWIKDIYDRQWAIPNYLTSRRFNIKLTAKF